MLKTSNLVIIEVVKSEIITEKWLDEVISKNQFVTVEEWGFNNQGQVEITSMYPVSFDEMKSLGNNIIDEFWDAL